MEFIRTDLQYYAPMCARHTTFTETTDTIVPDTEPDIGRILCAFGTISVKDELPQTDRILISGIVHVVVLYRPDGQEGIRFLQIPLSFAHIEETQGISAEQPCFVRCHLQRVSARAVNSRKVSVTGEIGLEIDLYQQKKTAVTEKLEADGADLQVRYGTKPVSLLQNVLTREYTVLDDVEVPGAQGMKLVHAQGIMLPVTCQPEHAQISLSGEVQLHLLLLDDTGKLQSMTHNVPYTQVLEAPDITDNLPITVRLALRSLDCMLREEGVLSVGVCVRALIQQRKEQTLQTIEDLYHLKKQLEISEDSAELYDDAVPQNYQAESMAQITLTYPATEILLTEGVCTVLDQENMKLQICVLYLDDTGNLWGEMQDTMVPLTLGPIAYTQLQDLTVHLSTALSTERDLQLRVSVNGTVLCGGDTAIRDITGLTAEQDREPIDKSGTTLILRYIQAPTALWDIAKQYASTVSEIQNANALPEHTEQASETMLLIPICGR